MTIGNTPVVYLDKFGIYLKLEDKNPTGSVKDRPVFFMVKRALLKGLIKPNPGLVEPTSGNTGIALAMMGAKYDFKVTIVSPENISKRKLSVIRSFGADIILTPAEGGMKKAVEKALELRSEGFTMLDQFNNPDNVLSHELTTGPEIIRQMGFDLEAFVCGVGTGGTITGVSRVLRKFFGESVRIFAVEPSESPVLSKGRSGRHGIEGIGAGFKPPLLEMDLVDDVITIETEEARKFVETLSKSEGLSVGISTGANVAAATKIRERFGFERILTMEMDGGLRYI